MKTALAMNEARQFYHAETPALLAMLESRRPANGDSERWFIKKFIDSLPNMESDDFGNRFVRIGRAPIAFSSHTDSVHHADGFQALQVNDGVATLATGSKSNCLGADCATGVWLMRQMILAGVEGLYIFHRQEESGANGASWIVKNNPALVEGIQAMIAFDRRGYDSIVTHQAGRETASRAFADSLAAQLNAHGFAFKPDDSGVFTDSEVYAHLIPECTNLSVGYFRQHSTEESQDLEFAESLATALPSINWQALAIARTPCGDKWSHWLDDESYSRGSSGYGFESMRELIETYPDAVLDILLDHGYDFRQLEQEIESRYGWNA